MRPTEGADADGVVVSVADDGPGIPAIEHDAPASGAETTLEHGSGLGLWLVRWNVQTAGGTVDFAESNPRGSVVELRLPAAEE